MHEVLHYNGLMFKSSAKRIIGPVLYADTINYKSCINH